MTLGEKIPGSDVMDLVRVMYLDNRFPTYQSLKEVLTDESGLSGGQKQRILLIRALLQKKEVLLLDESLSALDQNTFHKIEYYLTKLEQITLIHISHRYTQQSIPLYDDMINLSI